MSTKIKICGITREEDARAVVAAGADALGLMFVPASPRVVALDTARHIAVLTEGALLRVGVFADPSTEEVQQVLQQIPLDVLQFHGSEDRALCERWGLPYVKVVHMGGPVALDDVESEHPNASALLLDTYRPDVLGGTGERFDLSRWPRNARHRLVLAGGLTPDNVGDAILRTRPYGVDVSGGVEGSTKGIKSAARINEFVHAVRQVG